MKKVLFVLESLNGGGAEKIFLTYLAETIKHYEVNVLVLKAEGVYTEDVDKKFLLKNLSKNDFNLLLHEDNPYYIYNQYILSTYDIEIAFLEGLSTKFVSLSHNKKSKKIAWIHTNLELFHWTKNVYNNFEDEKNAYSKFDDLIFVSVSSQTAFTRYFGLGSYKCYVVNNPINSAVVINNSLHKDIQYSKFTFCIIGSLYKRKGHKKLLSVLSKLKYDAIECQIIILGTGYMLDELQRYCDEMKISNDVHFYGFKKNPFPYLRASNVLISASDVEGYPLVICEALSLHKPVIATNCTGNTDVLDNGKYGCLVESEEELYIAMKNAILNEEFYYDLISKAELGEKNLNYKGIINTYLSILEGKL